MADPAFHGLLRIWRAFINTSLGLRAAWQHEAAFRQELILAVVLTPLALRFGEGPVERALLLGSLLLILIVELLNSGLEATVDRIGPERHELSGRAKDLGSAAVFLAFVNALLIWFFLLVF